MLASSVMYRFLAGIAGWFSRQFQDSRLIQRFLTLKDGRQLAENTVGYRVFWWFRQLLSRLFYALRLQKVFDNSVFKMAFLWSILAAVMAPFLPTMLVMLLVLAASGSLFLSFLFEKDKNLVHFTANKYIYLFCGAYLFATFTSVARSASWMGGMLSVLFALFAIIIMNAIETKRQLDALLFLMVAMGILISLYGFYQFLNPAKYSGVWHDKDMFESISFRVYATLENPNVLGEYFLLIIPIAAALCITSKTWIMRLFYLGASGVMMVCLILTYSRGCYVGILVAAAVFLVLLDRRFILLGLLGLIALPFVLPQTIIERFLSIGNMADSSTSYRVYIWMGSIAMLREYWLCGIGPGADAFNLVYPAYAYNGISAPHSHNLFLQLICDAGIVGLLLFILIIYHFYKTLCASLCKLKDWSDRVLVIAGLSAISGFLVQSLFDYTFYNYRVTLLFWAVIGIGLVFTRLPMLKKEAAYCD